MARIRYDHAVANEEEAYSKEREVMDKRSSSMADKQSLSRLFEKAGESFIGAELSREEQISKAIGLYQKAERYAQYPEVKERIRRKVKKLEAVKTQLNSLEKIVKGENIPGILSISFLATALFFVSSSITGNVVLGFQENNSRFIGLGFFIAGLIFAFIYSKMKIKKKKKK